MKEKERQLKKILAHVEEIRLLDSDKLLEYYVRARISRYQSDKEGLVRVPDGPIDELEYYHEELMRRLLTVTY